MSALDDTSLWLVVRGLAANAGCQDVYAHLNGVRLDPSYVGLARANARAAGSRLASLKFPDAKLVELRVPSSLALGSHALTLVDGLGRRTSPHRVLLQTDRRVPVVISVTNDHDGGIDVYRRGGKSRFRVFVSLDKDTPLDALCLVVNGRPIPTQAEYLRHHGYFMLRASVPWWVFWPSMSVRVRNGAALSPAFRKEFAGFSSPASPRPSP